MIITLSVFYWLYLIIVGIFLLYSLFNVYHLLRFGFLSVINVIIVCLYILVSTAFLLFSFNLLLTLDWHQEILRLDGLNGLSQFTL